MRPLKIFSLVAVVTLMMTALVACERSEYAEELEDVAGSPAADVNPVEAEMAIDDVTIGNELGTDNSIPAGAIDNEFAAGETAYLAMEVGDVPAGSEVRVVWYGPDNQELNQESKTVLAGEHYLSFSADTTGWAPGEYRAEIWYGDEMVNDQDFHIQGEGEVAPETPDTN